MIFVIDIDANAINVSTIFVKIDLIYGNRSMGIEQISEVNMIYGIGKYINKFTDDSPRHARLHQSRYRNNSIQLNIGLSEMNIE